MLLKIDCRTVRQFAFVTQTENGGTRRYYVARQSSGRRMIIVCRGGLELASLEGQTVDGSVGWDPGTRGFVHESQIGRRHSKLTIYRLSRESGSKSLGWVFERAPMIPTPSA